MPDLKFIPHSIAFEVSTDVATFVEQCKKDGDSVSDVYRLALEWGLACMMAEAAEVQFTNLKTAAIHQSTYFSKVMESRTIRKPSKAADKAAAKFAPPSPTTIDIP